MTESLSTIPEERIAQSKAVASDVRLTILGWLKEPMVHFGGQESADPVTVGVCNALITDKLGMSQPTVSRHLDILKQAGFVTARRKERWTYYRRDEEALAQYAAWIVGSL